MGEKISQLDPIVTPALADIFPVVQSGVTYKETCTQLSALINATLQATTDYILSSTLSPQSIASPLTVNNTLLVSDSVSTAVPNVDVIIGQINDNVGITSGVFHGVSGQATIVSASGGGISGLEGLMTATGALTTGAAVFGTSSVLNLTGATINGALVSSIWAAFSGAGITGTDMSNTHNLVLDNQTGLILNSQVYLSGDALYGFELSGATTYYLPAGLAVGSAGDPAHCNAQQVLQIKVNGAVVYLPVFTQNT